jgi:hypothetical protein
MDAIKYSIVISPENVSEDIRFYPYSGSYYTESCGIPTEENKTYNFGLYSDFTSILSGGTNGTSLLTGLTVPILFTQSINDLGYYSEFDGFILQKNVVTNFLYSGDVTNIYEVTLYNTSGSQYMSFLKLSSYQVDWGDGSQPDNLTFTNQTATHLYPNVPSGYTISLKQTNPWGTTTISKKISLPNTGVTVNNLNGEIFFTPQGGSWSGIPLSYEYIYSGDSGYEMSQYVSEEYTTVPFVISGYTTSKLSDLRRYGPNPYTIGYIQYIKGRPLGQVTEMTPDYTAYTINDVNYYDLTDGRTFYIAESSGITYNDFTFSALTKDEYLLDFVMAPEIQSGVYIERGKYSGFEPLQRLGEVDNFGDLKRYGYGYFKINTT